MLEANTSGAHKRISEQFRAGYYFNAFDDAMTALIERPQDTALKHVAVLSLLRGGALQAALKISTWAAKPMKIFSPYLGDWSKARLRN